MAALSATPAEQLTDAWAERLFQLKRDIEADRVALDQVEQELAEAAANLGRGASETGMASRLRPPETAEMLPAF